jgi:hypothetical protein
MAVFAPMHKAITVIAATLNPRALRSDLKPTLTLFRMSSKQSSVQLACLPDRNDSSCVYM